VIPTCITYSKILERTLVSATRYLCDEYCFRHELLLRLSTQWRTVCFSEDSKCLFSGRNSVLNMCHMATYDIISFTKQFFPKEFDNQLLFHFLLFFPFIYLLSFLTYTVLHTFIFCISQSRKTIELMRRLCLCRTTFLWFTVSLLSEFHT
jgi:hypothetical protein